ncbi:glycosyltransferase family 4 protein [Pseudidiomarina gelatinasegens]|uniref:glycosyltransferase family 4 protein n=1 Tax=Pseudidiomarina gelatinasegens TaxID=2487740 RepID=UPI003A98594C
MILHIITGLGNGGAEGVLYRLCKFDKANEHVVISLMDYGKYGSLLEELGIKVHTLGMERGKFSIGAFWRLWRLIRYYKPEIVQTWMYHADLIGGLISKLAMCKSIYWNVRHSTLQSGQSKKTTILILKTCAILSRFVPKGIIYCAESAKIVHERNGYKNNNSYVLNNGFSLEQLLIDANKREVFRSNLNLNDSTFLIGMVARFDPQKDHFNLLKAFKLSKSLGASTKLALVGHGLDASNIEITALIEEFGLTKDVFLLGQQNDISSVMNGLDVHILSSAFGEGFPNVIAEAMACGTPCIATNVGDSKEIIGDLGWVVPPIDSARLSEAIGEAICEKLSGYDKWHRRRLDCRDKIVANFGIKKMIASYNLVWFKR